ncbi:MAG TPA: hypothetical protein VK867_03720 [Candidatus Limnocylindrales bacterium]|nr:hypothetical protein [Candidatus Limnocylindrales bacterium]
MDRRTGTLFAVLLIGVVGATALAAILLAEPSGPDLPPGMEQVTGVVVAVDAVSLSDVRGFTLRRPGGELIEFSLRALEDGTRFAPGHLAEHQATADPIRVTFLREDDELLAIRLEDAPR